MSTLDTLRARGLVDDSEVYSFAADPLTGEVHRVNFYGGWSGFAGHGNSEPGDIDVPLPARIPVRLVRAHFGPVIAREDMPAVQNAAAGVTVAVRRGTAS